MYALILRAGPPQTVRLMYHVVVPGVYTPHTELPPFDLFAICADLSTDEATTVMVQKSKCQVRHVNRVGVAGFWPCSSVL
jgi:hypothetical protein